MARLGSLRRKQGGAVAIIVGFTIAVLIGMLGLVLDLGHLYIVKTELQNAADAAALAGAKELNGSLAGVNNAVSRAIEAAGRNRHNFNATAVTLTLENLWVGNCPDDGCMVLVNTVTSDALAADKTFLKADTGEQTLNTWFIQVLPAATTQTQTFGMAVAGRYVIDVTPLGVCAVDKTRPERGFIRGVAYNVPELNPLIINPDFMWINPVNAPPDGCGDIDPSWNSTAKLAPFVCTGKSAVVKSLPGEVFVNTGKQSGLSKELNSRFDVFQGSKCSWETAPPDTNVRQYPYDVLPLDWTEPSGSTLPSQQGITINNATRKPVDKTVSGAVRPQGASAGQYGALWANAWEKNFATGANHTLDDWQSLYGVQSDQGGGGYPTTPATPHPSPYAQTSGKYFLAPSSGHRPGLKGRRLVNLVIIDCDASITKNCGSKGVALPTLAVGEYFMPVKADLPGKELFMEFSRLIAPPLPPADIRLYR